MNEKITFESELNRIVYAKVVRGEYPITQSIDHLIESKNGELNDARRYIIKPFPNTKEEYFAVLKRIENEIAVLNSQNAQLRSDNEKSRSRVDTQYNIDIELAKKDPKNIWAALRVVRNAQLSETDWTQLVDSPLSDEEKKSIADYRKTLRDVPQLYEKVEEAVSVVVGAKDVVDPRKTAIPLVVSPTVTPKEESVKEPVKEPVEEPIEVK